MSQIPHTQHIFLERIDRGLNSLFQYVIASKAKQSRYFSGDVGGEAESKKVFVKTPTSLASIYLLKSLNLLAGKPKSD